MVAFAGYCALLNFADCMCPYSFAPDLCCHIKMFSSFNQYCFLLLMFSFAIFWLCLLFCFVLFSCVVLFAVGCHVALLFNLLLFTVVV